MLAAGGYQHIRMFDLTSGDLNPVVNYGGISKNVMTVGFQDSASKISIRRFVITEKAPTRAFSWLKAATTTFTFKTLC